MYQPDDVRRSIRRYLSYTFGAPPWRIRVERREVADDARPIMVVQLGPLSDTFARETLEQGDVTALVPVTVYAYPEKATNERAGVQQGEAIRAQLRDLIRFGLPTTFEHGDPPADVSLTLDDDDGRPAAGPYRIPLYDYEGVPMEGERVEPSHPHTVMRVLRESVSVRGPIQDPDDPRRLTVALEFRAQLEAPGRALPRQTWAAEPLDGDWVPEPTP